MCSSTTPKTKAASPAVNDPAKMKKQAGTSGGGSGGGSSTPPPLKFTGVQEHVPDLTFIIEPRVPGDDYLAGATTYHTNCGLAPREIHSIDHMVTFLAANSSALKRIRCVGHANGQDLIIPMFGQTSVQGDRHTFKEHLTAFAESDERGLLTLIGLGPGQHFYGWSITSVLSMIRTSNSTLLDPFDIGTSGLPPANLEAFIEYCCDHAFINLNRFKKNNGNLTAAEKTGMLKAMKSIVRIRSKGIEGKKFGTHTVTAGELQLLRDYLFQRNAADLNLGPNDVYGYSMGANDLNPFLLAGRAADSVDAGFRANLDKVKLRFSKDSYIDIRGCRLGQDPDYLKAMQEFLGQPTAKPSVTAPTWYQSFSATNSYSHPTNNAQINTLLHTGLPAAGIRAGFATWSTMTHVDPEHKQAWTDILTGSAVKFVLMEWKKTLPVLPVATPGLTAFVPMNFIDSINKTRDFFNVPAASMPAAAALTAIDTFISSKLTGYATNLLFPVDGATVQTKLNSLLTALNTINTELGNVVTPVPPAPANFTAIEQYQKKLVTFIDDNKINAIKPFMTAVKQRIDDTNDPGFYYYMLHSGMPVFVLANRELVNNHQVNIQNNRLVVLDAFANEAYRKWPQLLWAEPLPAGNNFPTLQPGDFNSRRFPMMVEQPTGGNIAVAACPHPDYMDKITSV